MLNTVACLGNICSEDYIPSIGCHAKVLEWLVMVNVVVAASPLSHVAMVLAVVQHAMENLVDAVPQRHVDRNVDREQRENHRRQRHQHYELGEQKGAYYYLVDIDGVGVVRTVVGATCAVLVRCVMHNIFDETVDNPHTPKLQKPEPSIRSCRLKKERKENYHRCARCVVHHENDFIRQVFVSLLIFFGEKRLNGLCLAFGGRCGRRSSRVIE
jgi:hypothetical protein